MAKPAVWLDDKRFLPFSLYALLIAVLGALIVEAIKGEWEHHPHLIYWTVSLAAIVLSMGFYYHHAIRRFLAQNRQLQTLAGLHELPPAKSRGLALLISRGAGASSAIWAIRYHGESLSHLWLIHSSDAGSIEGCTQIEELLRQEFPRVKPFRRSIDDLNNVESAMQLVQSIHLDAQAQGLRKEDIICDFTGMTKPTSAGMVLACLEPDERLQYMRPSKFKPDGSPDPSAPSDPIEIHLRYEDLEPVD